MQVARNIMVEPRLLPGGGATEMALAHALTERSKSVVGVGQWPYRAIAKALEIIPRTLLQNCGANTIRVLTALRVSGMGEWRNVEWGNGGMWGRGIELDYPSWRFSVKIINGFQTVNFFKNQRK